jgi:hypothetical protein
VSRLDAFVQSALLIIVGPVFRAVVIRRQSTAAVRAQALGGMCHNDASR